MRAFLAITFSFLMLIVSGINGNSDIELLIKKKAGSKQPFQGHKIVRAFPVTKNDVNLISSLEYNPSIEVDFWARTRNIDIHVGPEDYTKLDNLLRRSNIKFSILNNNLQASLDEEEKAHYRHSKGWHGDYHTYDQIVQKITNLANTHESQATLVKIGQTYEKRDLMGIEIRGSKQVPNKQKAVLMCGQHAREWVSPATCLYMMEKILENYGKQSEITAMVDRFNWVIFPLLNPDGYAHTWTSEDNRLWRKNREPNFNSSCHGTDLNRNWGYKWGGTGSSGLPCSDVYRGPSSFSALETKAMSEYLKANRQNVFTFIDIHSYSQLWMYPWSYTVDKRIVDEQELSRVSNMSVKSLNAKYGTDFKAGPAGIIIYEAAGSGKDWTYGEIGIKYSFALELRDQGQHGFLLPKAQIVPTGEETLASLQTLAVSMMDYGEKTTSYYTQDNTSAGTDEAAGSSRDWSYGKIGIKYSFGLELRDQGKHGFLLPKDQIVPTGEETLAALQTLAVAMMDYGEKTTTYYTQNNMSAGTNNINN